MYIKYKEWLARQIDFAAKKATENAKTNKIASLLWETQKDTYEMALKEFNYECEFYYSER